MTGVTCRFVQEKTSGGRMDGIADADRVRVISHLAGCRACQDFRQVSDSLVRMAAMLAPEPIPPLLERRALLAALDGRNPTRPNNRRLWYRLALVGA